VTDPTTPDWPRSAVVIGASAGVGRALAEVLAGRGCDLVLAARHERDLRALAADLTTRHGVRATAVPLDLAGPDEDLDRWYRACTAELPEPDAVLVTAGTVDDADDGLAAWDLSARIVTTNFTSVMKLAGRFVAGFEERGGGTLVLFSSIAAAAPRRRNVAYAASKAALEAFGRSLQHRVAGTEVRVQVYALGYVDTAMTRGRQLRLPPVAPAAVADHVVAGLRRDRRVSYYPRYWAPVTRGLRMLPWSVYRRLDF
jgi:short-subunit dehydrogenase